MGAATTIDGNPTNNFLNREVTFNPNGILAGARAISIAGNYAYVCCDAGLVVVDLDDPKQPQVRAVLGEPHLKEPCAVQVQFRYAFVCDKEGVKVLDVTNLAQPRPLTHLPFRMPIASTWPGPMRMWRAGKIWVGDPGH